jgi:yersiniabactin nonribosomal peptide/polyketide synthase
MADDPPRLTAASDGHDLARLALPLPEQAQLDELEATWRWLERVRCRGLRPR